MLLKIKDVRESKFNGRTGEEVTYYWYRATRLSDKCNIRFGSKNGEYESGDEVDLNVEKFELPSGQVMYKEVE